MSLYNGVIPVLLKQIPYTMMQLSSFELITTTVYTTASTEGLQLLDETLHRLPFIVTVCAAVVAAVLSSLVSQPGDVLLSAVNKKALVAPSTASFDATSSSEASSAIDVMLQHTRKVGARGLFAGTQARLYHVTFFVVIQLLVYDVVKSLCGIPVTGMH